MDESVVKEFEQQQVGKLKLSQAIRIGAKLRPQCTGAFYANGGSCALGAASEAISGYPYASFSSWSAYFNAPKSVLDAVVGMNDHNGYTREAIADWLEAQGL